MSSKDFKAVFKNHGSAVRIEMAGPMNENCKLGPVPTEKQVYINLEKVTQLNSAGIREWCDWIQAIPESSSVVLDGCPFIFVKSFSLIKGVLPPNASVNSIFLPFYSAKTKEERNVLLLNGIHFSNSGIVKLPSETDQSGNPMELDPLTSRYLSFLAGRRRD